ncbi:MAG: TrbI/VirB10 family protein, partial [Verrucomicrobiales bacterium]|nr:TrbI/VirB10 family protein [Verrucomicrobiales bacterium]
QLSKDYAPIGGLTSCQLIITAYSSALDTPIIGIVTEDVWHDGRLIVPVGTEVHGTARVDRMRERIASQGQWTLVWQDGKEMRLSGLALDREKEASGEGWAITDGSAGLRGQLLKSDDYAEVKLFVASFLSGAAGAFTERETTLLGSQATATVGNAGLGGIQQVLNTYARQIMDTIEREGFYVRVPAGKQFYLYVTETMDASNASVGGTRIPLTTTKP